MTELIQSSILTLPPETKVKDAVDRINQAQIRCALVVDQYLVGIFTEQNLFQAIASGIELTALDIAAVMTRSPIVLHQSEVGNLALIRHQFQQHQLQYLPVVDDYQQPVGVISLHGVLELLQSFITDCSQTEAALRHSELTARLLLEANPNLMIRLNREGTYLDFRPAKGFKSFTPDLLMQGKNIFEVMPADFARQRMHYVELALQTGTTQSYEFEFEFEGDRRYQEAQISVSGINEVLIVVRDITDRRQTEAKLQESEKCLRTILESSPLPIFIKDIQGRYTIVNRAYEQITQLTRENLLGISDYEILPADYAKTCWDSDQAALNSDKPIVFEERVPFLQQARDLLVTKFALCDSSEQPYGIGGILIDFTDRKQIEEASRESTERFDEIAATISQVFFVRSASSGEYFYISPAYEKIWGRTCASLYQDAHSWLEAIHPDDRQQVLDSVAEQWQGHSVLREYRIIRPDDDIRWIKADVMLVKDADGNSLRFVGIAEDITDRKLAEQQLLESQHFIQRIAESTPNLLYIYDLLEHRNIYVNREVSQMLGYTPEEVQALGNQMLQTLMHPDDFVAFGIHIHRLMAVQEGDVLEFEYRMQRKNGEWCWLYSRDTLFLRTSAGMPQQILGTAVDITARKLGEQQIHFQSRLLDTVEQAVIAIDVTGCITYWNRYAETLYGWPRAEAVGQPIGFLIPEPDRPDTTPIMLCLQSEDSWTGEVKMQRQDGTTFTALVVSSPIYDEPGNWIGTVSISSDITERKRIEAALRQSERCYRAVVEDQTELITRFRADTTVTFVNEAYCRYFGLTQAEVIGQTYRLVIIADDRPLVEELVKSLSFNNPVVTIENRVLTANGEVRWTQWINRAIFNEQDQIVEFQAVGRDITDRKQVEIALRESEEKFRQLANHVQDVFWIVSPQNVELLYVSPVFEKVWGQPREKVARNPYAFMDFIHPDDQLQVRNAIAERDRHWGDLELEYRIVRPNGEIRWIRDRGFPIRNEAGQAYRIVGVASDITDRKQSEVALQQAKEAAEAANRAKSEFLSRMSHELRTPLTSVLGFADLIARDTCLSPEHQENLAIIRRSGTYLLNLINSVLEMSRIESGELTLDETSFDLHRLLESIQALFHLKAASKGLGLCVTWNPDLPQHIQTDENKLRQVLLNLLDNAIKFTETGNIALRVSRVQKGESLLASAASPLPTYWLRFQVADTGMGIAPEELSILFDAFVQTETGRKLQQGTGLGLAISRQFVQMLGGEITVESQVERGTTITFEVQVHAAEAGTTVSSALAQQLTQQQVTGLATSTIYRILIVDDQAETRKILVKVLEPIGFEVQEATNGREALAAWEQWQPHLIWMDMQMPIVNGYIATQAIRDRERQQAAEPGQQVAEQGTPDSDNCNEAADDFPDSIASIRHSSTQISSTKIIALTANAFDQQRSNALAAGCDDFVTKPFQYSDILEKIAEHLEIEYQWTEFQLAEERLLLTDPMSDESDQTLTLLLQTMPATWGSDLRSAALRLNSSQCFRLIEQIPATYSLLAQKLTELVNQFQFDAIVDCLEQLD